MFQRLGIGQLRAILNAKPMGAAKPTGAAKPMGAAEPTGAAKPTDAASEDSGSLYQPGDEDMEQEAVDKVYALFHYVYSFVFNMQNYLSCFNLLCAGGNAGFGA